MIRTATAYDIPVLKRIWDESFDDSVNYIDFIFDRLANPEDAIVFEDGGNIVSMLLMLETRFMHGSESVDAVYILGAATRKKFQNRGIMTYMLDYAENVARERGRQLALLVPGEPYLVNYYKKRGYSPDFKLRALKLRPGMLEQVPAPDKELLLDAVSPGKIAEIRENALADIPHIVWNGQKMRFVMEDSFVYGDHVALYSGSCGEAYAFYACRGRKMLVKECLGSSSDAMLVVVKELVRRNRARNVTIHFPLRVGPFGYEGETLTYGMGKPLNVSSFLRDMEPYMNLMFD